MIMKSISKLSTTSKTSTAKVGTSRPPSVASVRLSGSPKGSSTSLKSLRGSMKSMILPSMVS